MGKLLKIYKHLNKEGLNKGFYSLRFVMLIKVKKLFNYFFKVNLFFFKNSDINH